MAQSGWAQWKRKAQLRSTAALAGAGWGSGGGDGRGDSGFRYGREKMK